MRCSYADDPQLSDQVFELLDQVFTGLRQAARDARAHGTDWEAISTPYTVSVAGQLIAHLGLIELPLMVAGQTKTVGSIHAVATHPEYRRRGYFRQLMEQVLADTQNRYETLILTTENPEYYEPFGFRRVQEHRFTIPWSGPAGRDGIRPLNPDDATDLALLHTLLAQREPVSNRLGVRPERDVFCFNECPHSLQLLPDLDVILCLERQGASLILYDVVGRTVPLLAELLARTPWRGQEVITYFTPDRLEVAASATPHVLDMGGPAYLMVKGEFVTEDLPFMLPRSGRT